MSLDHLQTKEEAEEERGKMAGQFDLIVNTFKAKIGEELDQLKDQQQDKEIAELRKQIQSLQKQ